MVVPCHSHHLNLLLLRVCCIGFLTILVHNLNPKHEAENDKPPNGWIDWHVTTSAKSAVCTALSYLNFLSLCVASSTGIDLHRTPHAPLRASSDQRFRCWCCRIHVLFPFRAVTTQVDIADQVVKLPGVTGVSTEQLAGILASAVKNKMTGTIKGVCKLQVAQDIPKELVADHLQPALQLGRDAVASLCSLLLVSGDKRSIALPAATFKAVIQTALVTRKIDAVVPLLNTDVAEQELTGHVVEQLLQQAVDWRCGDAVAALCELPVAKHMAAGALERLLGTTVRVKHRSILQVRDGTR